MVENHENRAWGEKQKRPNVSLFQNFYALYNYLE